ncbi:MAG: AraC family transcriptional regulator [Myxococcota bacterium]|nr:AraC family transcriptional regulator [Myxococcota bacterium]
MLEAAEAAGAAAEELAAEARIPRALLKDVDARIPHHQHLAVWRGAVARVRNPAFPLAVARRLSPSTYGVVGYSLAYSTTPGEAVAVVSRYSRLIYDELRLTSEDRGEDVAIHCTLAGSAPPPELFEATLSTLVLLGRHLAGTERVPVREVHLRHLTTGLGDALGLPVLTATGENAVIVPRRVLQMPVRSADGQLAGILKRHAQEMLARLPPDDDLVAEVRHTLLRSTPPTLSAPGRVLGIGPRTLQRRLRAAGRSLRELHDEVRCEQAVTYLADPRRSVSEVAFLLGFSEVSSFHRAFRRWTGRSPRG